MKSVPAWVWTVGVSLVTGALGWWVGSWTACASSEGCEVRVASVEALGTWVGGIATAAGLVFAGIQLRLNRAEAESRQRLEAERRRILARQVTISVLPHTAAFGRLDEFKVVVKNTSDEYVTAVDLFVGDRQIDGTKEQVHPGLDWTWTLKAAPLLSKEIPARPSGRAFEDPELVRAVKDEVLPLLRIQYTIEGTRFERDFQSVKSLAHEFKVRSSSD